MYTKKSYGYLGQSFINKRKWTLPKVIWILQYGVQYGFQVE